MQAMHNRLRRRVESSGRSVLVDSDNWSGAEVNTARGLLVGSRYSALPPYGYPQGLTNRAAGIPNAAARKDCGDPPSASPDDRTGGRPGPSADGDLDLAGERSSAPSQRWSSEDSLLLMR